MSAVGTALVIALFLALGTLFIIWLAGRRGL